MEKYSVLGPEPDLYLPKDVEDEEEEREKPKLYKNRWVMLAILTLLTALNISQWLFYSAISNIIMYHYNISSLLAQMLSLNNMAIYAIFGLPSTFIVNKTDLKIGCIISGGLSLVALWIKYLGTGTGGFYITLCGQIVASFGTCFVLPLPAHLASTWFGVLERSTATSIAASGLNIGMGLAYLFSSQFVPHTKSHVDIEHGLQKSILVQAIICSLTIIATVLDFEIQPPSPPSQSQAVIDDQPSITFTESIQLLIKNKSYIFTLLGSGIIAGVFYSFFSLLSGIILSWFPGEEKKMGWMGFLGSIIGIPGMYLAGYLLDKTKAYKQIFVVYTALIALTMLGFTFAVMYGSVVWMPFIVIAQFGFLTSGLIIIGFVLASELTYPTVPQVYSSGMLLSAGTFFGVIILGVTSITTDYSVEFVNWFLTGACFLAFFFSPFVKAEYPRLVKDNEQ